VLKETGSVRAYKRYVVGRLCSCCSVGKALNIIYSECVSVSTGIQHAKCMRHITSSVAWPVVQHYPTISHKLHGFREKVIEHEMCVLNFSTQFV
jgi:hypothetical protein